MNKEKLFAVKSTAPPQHQVFVSFRGSDVRHNFFSFLKDALIKNGINVVTDEDVPRGKPIDENLLKLIRNSRIAVVIFSENYPESTWCLDELVEIEKQMDLKKLDSCPIFFEIETCHVKLHEAKSSFDYNLLRLEHRERKKARQINKKAWEDAEERFDGWRRALVSVASRLGLTYKKNSNQATFVNEIVDKVKAMLDNVSSSDIVPQHQVYICYRGQEMRSKFSSFLRAALQKSGINVLADDEEDITRIESRDELDNFFVKIQESRIVLMIITKNHTSSAWFLEEMLEMNKRAEMKMLRVIPIFYEMNPNDMIPHDKLMELFGSTEDGIKGYEEYKDALDALTSFISTQHK
ncbi:PREDICTED: vesicle-associated protein 1-4-like [Camelina sativa]|uniref:Vesicle-associated protein 1-4-like n=1 Tax=Camelina sativa TaxID=90675 RepID=A0ABM1QC30_CAMSA|nr:PREDICTED: vesicle-associated protein 1-4-like [Camelina sativa]